MADTNQDPSQRIDEHIKGLADWRGETLAQVRGIIKDADPDVVEQWKWEKPSSGGVPVWYHDGGICTGETYKDKIKLTFFQGVALDDPAGLFNSSLGGKVRRAIDIRESDEINERALGQLIRAAIAFNIGG
jgi:hypothetical protein